MNHITDLFTIANEPCTANGTSVGASFVNSFEIKPVISRRRKMPAKTLFLSGPIPVSLISAAAGQGGSCTETLLAIWLQCSLKRSNRVKITNKMLGLFNVLPDAGRRALSKLEGIGLLQVERHRGRCPLVTLFSYLKN